MTECRNTSAFLDYVIFSGKATLSLAVRTINFTVANEKKTGN